MSRILIVDDSGLARRSTRRILEDAGFEVVEAVDGMSALEQYCVQKPDAVSRLGADGQGEDQRTHRA